jgi:hypothetical protein
LDDKHIFDARVSLSNVLGGRASVPAGQISPEAGIGNIHDFIHRLCGPTPK